MRSGSARCTNIRGLNPHAALSPSSIDPHAGPAHCPNCSNALPVPPPPFCAQCGQETRVRAPTVMQFMQEFGGAYISTEGALWRSLKLLLTRPGALTRDYLRGKRRSYVLPLRLYLTISVLTFALLRLFAHAAPDPTRSAALEKAVRSGVVYVVSLGVVQVGREHGRFVCSGLPDWYCEHARTRLEDEQRLIKGEALQQAPERMVGSMGRAMFVLLPLFALWLKLLFWRRDGQGLRYTEHLVFALHLHCVWFLALWLPLVQPLLAPLAVAWGLGHLLLALRRVYERSWGASLWRAVLLLALHGAALVVALIVSALLTVL